MVARRDKTTQEQAKQRESRRDGSGGSAHRRRTITVVDEEPTPSTRENGSAEAGKKSSKEKKRQAKKKKKKDESQKSTEESSSSSSSESSSETSSSGPDEKSSTAESEDESGEPDSTGEENKKRKKGRKKKKKETASGNWEIMGKFWALEDRPAHLRRKKEVEKMSLGRLMKLKDLYEKEAEKKGIGSAIFGLDEKTRSKKFKAKKDNGVNKLHPARWERLPMAQPKKYWKKVPRKREEIFRHLHLSHYGAEGLINESTLVRLHDRQVPVELNMLHAANFTKVGKEAASQREEWADPGEVRQLQEAVLNYAVVMQVLWPFDYGPMVIMRVLIESRWGEAAGNDDKERVRLVSR